MNDDIGVRAVICARYITENRCTVRTAAKYFGLSKSTVHKDVSERLKNIDFDLYMSVKGVLEINKAERHLRGGIATQKKYREMKSVRAGEQQRELILG